MCHTSISCIAVPAISYTKIMHTTCEMAGYTVYMLFITQGNVVKKKKQFSIQEIDTY